MPAFDGAWLLLADRGCSTGLAGMDVAAFELCDRCDPSAARASSETSCTAASAPEELEDMFPRGNMSARSMRGESITGSDRSEKDTASRSESTGIEAVLVWCLSGVSGGDPLKCTPSAWPSCVICRSTGSEFECPTNICPDRKDDRDRLPRDLCDDVCDDRPPRDRCDVEFLNEHFKSLLQRGQKVALINQRSTHFA